MIGDTYNSTQAKDENNSGEKHAYKDYSFRKSANDIPRKSLIGIPERLMIAMIDDGWICRNNIIWQKPNAMPSSVNDRFTIDYENILFFVKSDKYYFNQIKEKMVTKDISSPRGSNGVIGEANSGRRKQDEVDRNDYKGFNDRYVPPIDYQRNKRAVWVLNTQPTSIKHYAMFPETLVETMLEAGAIKKGLVLDIFAGAGTTLKVAKQNGYNYIGIELYEKNCKIIEKRLNSTPKMDKLL